MAGDNVWIVGASHGIGKALALELAGRGHRVIVSARNEEALHALCTTLEGMNAQEPMVQPVDVCDRATIIQARDNIMRNVRHIHRVIFMAGLYHPMSLDMLDIEETERILSCNLLGAFYVIEAILPLMLKQGMGQIALCSSVAGYRGLPKAQPYGASKAGLINLAESLYVEHGRTIDIKLINPGFVKTRLTDKNDFAMPMRISPEQAAHTIANGLESTSFEIHFPKTFSYGMKFLRIIPHALYRRLTMGRL
ncbi:MAG: SDR family NAD(P)-dependent oxidoreductase [Alphaproteobacteria bacterium GM7ARS4]|nr:SDR family NAD(P)-dependent oxidoreductase [Alphaproteobacteria bacterium GM7ARS4]